MTDFTAIQILALLVAVVAIAFLYSSVGHGGATGYLAVMSLVGVAPDLARAGALWLNCFVASVALWRFSRAGFFETRVFAAVAVASAPMAWLGSRMHLTGLRYNVVLGVTLAAAGWFLGWGRRNAVDQPIKPVRLPLAVALGGGLGMLAGMTGIGGGIFLTPLLIFLHWAPAKTASGISAAFILVNSAAGLAGMGRAALIWKPEFIIAPALAVAAALAGTYLGVRRWRTTTFRRVLAVVLWIAAAKMLLSTVISR